MATISGGPNDNQGSGQYSTGATGDPVTTDFATQPGFLAWLISQYGRDPFTSTQHYVGGGGESWWDQPILPNFSFQFLQDIVSAYAADISPDELTAVATNPEAQAAFNAGKTSGINRWLKQNNPPGFARATGPKYASAADEIAHMEPLARQAYYREQAIKEEEDFYRANQGAYDMISKYFGLGRYQVDRNMVRDIMAHGHDAASWEAYTRTLPSGHIPGMNIGTYSDAKTLLDTAMQPIYGHPGNDDMIRQLVDGGNNTKTGVAYFLDQMELQPGKNISPLVYNALYQGAKPESHATWNQEPSPAHLADIWKANGSPGAIAPTDAQQVAAAAGQNQPGQQPQQPTPQPGPNPDPNQKPQLAVAQ